MQLSLEIIKRRLEKRYTASLYGEPHTGLTLSRPKYYYPGLHLKEGGFYIIDHSAYGAENWDGCFLACAGGAVQPPKHGNFRLLVIEGASIGEAINSINEIYDFYDAWDLSLKTRAKTGAEHVHAMLDASIPVFENIIRLMNANFKFEYVSDEEQDKAPDVMHPDESGFVPLDIVNSLKADPYYSDINEVRAPYIFPAGILPFNSLCVNLLTEGRLVGRIVINEVARPIHETDFTLLAHLAEYVQDAYIDLLQTRDQPIFEMKYAIERVLDGNDPGATDLMRIIGKYHWARHDSFVCLKFSSDELTSPEKHYFCREFEKRCKGACAIEFDESIVVITNLSLGGQTYETFVPCIEPFVKEGFYKVGASVVFDDITHLRWRYLQAQIALETGMQSDSSNWVFNFEDFRFRYLMGKCAEGLLPEFVCHTELARLKRIDAETGANYFESLSLYLKNCRNAVQTADALFIHRLTLIYRLNRIKELTSLRWDTPEDYFSLLLSINILEHNL
ncbi:MAG: helix-turn-helix domain-containing protein [Clostridiales bacterium]|nr:helix-turn-helix domain-containing protein [Clostridiales bacterium]